MSNFKTWLKTESGDFHNLGNPIDNGETPASGEVQRTGLQPQVDAQEINTKSKAEQDKIGAIDAQIERISDIVSYVDDEHNKLGKFKQMWDQLLDAWEVIKFSDIGASDEGSGLGSHSPNEKLLDTMRSNQPLPHDNVPAGPGTFGVS